VTEPTPFGLNDLELAVGAGRAMHLPMGLVINRADMGDHRVQEFATRENLPILLEIPFDRQVAETYAQGGLLVESLPEWRGLMLTLFARIQAEFFPAGDAGMGK
jgi:MinD superfamily P-loop ATPase